MNRFRALSAASFLAAAAMFFSAPIHAMQIQEFDRMAAPDRKDYVNLLTESAQKVLTEAGRQNDAAKTRQLFTQAQRGEAEFESNLALARVADGVSGPKGPRATVEDAFAVTLKKNGIELPGSFFTVASKFLPPIVPTPSSKPAASVPSRPAPSDDDDPIGPGGFITPPQR